MDTSARWKNHAGDLLGFKLRPTRGQSLLEFALSLTLILILLAGMINLGIAFFTYVQMRDAAQEGALYGSAFNDFIEIENRACDLLGRLYDTAENPYQYDGYCDEENKVEVEISHGGCVGNTVTVTIRYNSPIVMPFLGTVFAADSIPLTATATDTILQPFCP